MGGLDRQLALAACQLSSLLCIIAPRSPANLRNPTPPDTPPYLSVIIIMRRPQRRHYCADVRQAVGGVADHVPVTSSTRPEVY